MKGSRVEKLQAELSSQKERFEEVDLLRSKVKELKLRSEQTMEGKAKIEDEVEMLRSKAALYEDVLADNAQLKAQYDALTSVSGHTPALVYAPLALVYSGVEMSYVCTQYVVWLLLAE